jgi:5-methylcytosine-specific restriction endonuclease McrBC GTP-binding regulatory subunit McrB
VNNSTKQRPYIFDKTENSEWYLTDEGVRFVEENLSEQLEQLNSKNSQREIEDFYKFITFHQSYSYEEFVEGIKPRIDTDTENSTISYEYNKGIFKEICQQANSDPDNNYLLIIDEINRGNISKIFGELITLIETDKRVTPNGERIFENTKVQNEQLLVTLPYTKSKFGVPKNLYILGTMNTSDRSIASIDIALRRRFKFIEMMPDSQNVPNEEIGDFNLREIFETLNKRISVLLDRDHQIGHSYFMNWQKYDMETLQDVWFDSIMPLLNEYFYGDWDKLRAILGDTIKVESPNDKYSSFLKKVEDVDFAMKYDCDDNDGYDFVNKKEICFEEALKNAFPTIAKNNKPKENVADVKE